MTSQVAPLHQNKSRSSSHCADDATHFDSLSECVEIVECMLFYLYTVYLPHDQSTFTGVRCFSCAQIQNSCLSSTDSLSCTIRFSLVLAPTITIASPTLYKVHIQHHLRKQDEDEEEERRGRTNEKERCSVERDKERGRTRKRREREGEENS